MPCSDVTEVFRLILDDADHLKEYQLFKRTCGRAVGESGLLLETFSGKHAEELLAIDTDDFADAHPVESDEEMFLQLKHLFAVQSALRVLLGIEAGGPNDGVTVASVAFEDGNTILEAEISINIITEKIKSCGRCKGCGSLNKLKAARSG